ncbi:Satratoxin biosynthesis SC1 cluster protein, partial [Lachnellula suecica]
MSLDPTTNPRLAAYLEGAMAVAATQDLAQDERSNTRVLSIVFTVLAVVFVGLRFLARHKQNAQYQVDDWLMVLALAFLFGNLACVLVMVNNGLGLHSGALSLNQAMSLGKILLVNEPLYVTNINIIKISLLAMYYRIFPVRDVKIGALILGLISTSWNLALLGLAEGQCTPYAKNWQPWLAGSCIDLHATFLAISVPSILTDVAILCLPLPHVWRLQTNTTQKVSLSVIFLLGSFVVFTSIYRFTVYLNYDANDLPYTLALGCAWNIVELSSGIISACLPCLGPIVRTMIKSIGGTTLGSSGSKNKSGGVNSGLNTIGGTGAKQHRAQRSASFYRLKESQKYNISDSDLRPEHGGKVAVTITGTGGSDSGGDEIPLRAIRHQTDVEQWSEERVEGGDKG